MKTDITGKNSRHHLCLRKSHGGQAGQAPRLRSEQAFRVRSGQAMIEFLLGLVSIAVLVAVLVQINYISAGDRNPEHPVIGHTRMVVDARNDIADVLNNSSGSFEGDYLSDWEAGSDGFKYTGDDTSVDGDYGDFQSTVDPAMALGNLVSKLVNWNFNNDGIMALESGSSSSIGETFGFVRQEGQSTFERSYAVQSLVGGSEEFTLEHEIYMPQINGLQGASGVQ